LFWYVAPTVVPLVTVQLVFTGNAGAPQGVFVCAYSTWNAVSSMLKNNRTDLFEKTEE